MFVGAGPDIRTYLQGYSDYLSSSAGQAAQERTQSVGECVNSIWTGYWVVVPDSEQQLAARQDHMDPRAAH